MRAEHYRLHSPELGRDVHVWAYGHWGQPIVAFPTSAGMAHEWAENGMIQALKPLIDQGRIKLYCPETNIAETWFGGGSPAHRMYRHGCYERFVVDQLAPAIRRDCDDPNMPILAIGASVGALYAANLALKHPELCPWSLCLSGRYRASQFLRGYDGLDLYYADPLAYVPRLHGDALQRIQRSTRLTLVCGRGPYEGGCIEETEALAAAMRQRDVPHELDLWGHDSAHEWDWWHRQTLHHLGRRLHSA